MRFVINFAAATLVATIVVPHYAERLQARLAPQDALTASRPRMAAKTDDSVEVPRDAYGHFRVAGRIDGRDLDFVVDTGASVIALTADDAAEVGIHPGAADYTVLLRTANGTVRAAPATLGMVEIGDIMMHDVAAVVLPQGALSDNLLGMSFLSRLHHFDYSNGKMVLQQ
ncbi:MAG: retropepsin-like aspartic protease family protein [Xanthobacteraceae bacterium]